MRPETRNEYRAALAPLARTRELGANPYARLVLAFTLQRLDDPQAPALLAGARRDIARDGAWGAFLAIAIDAFVAAGYPRDAFLRDDLQPAFDALPLADRHRVRQFCFSLPIAMWQRDVDDFRRQPEAVAMPVLAGTLDRIESPAAAARALVTIAHFGWGELVERPFAVVMTNPHDVVVPVVTALRKLGMRDELCVLLETVAPVASASIGDKPLVCAGAWEYVGDPRGAQSFRAVLDLLLANRDEGKLSSAAVVRALARGSTLATLPCALAHVRELAALLPRLDVPTYDNILTKSRLLDAVASVCLIADDYLDD